MGKEERERTAEREWEGGVREEGVIGVGEARVVPVEGTAG